METLIQCGIVSGSADELGAMVPWMAMVIIPCLYDAARLLRACRPIPGLQTDLRHLHRPHVGRSLCITVTGRASVKIWTRLYPGLPFQVFFRVCNVGERTDSTGRNS